MLIEYELSVNTVCPVNELPVVLNVVIVTYKTIYVEDLQSVIDKLPKKVTQEDFHTQLRRNLSSAESLTITGLHHGFKITTRG